uniref:Uncharacterized protein n=1 Tax=Lepeophtheirus salmonis TaxID=72036 RepID=A0A0K2UM40_LEPSM
MNPIGASLNKNLPQGVIKYVIYLYFSSSSICQYPCFASKVVKSSMFIGILDIMSQGVRMGSIDLLT